jgi:hypothetical protein
MPGRSFFPVWVLILSLGMAATSFPARAQIYVEGVMLTEELAPRYILVQKVGEGRMTPLDVDYGSPHRPCLDLPV